MMHRASCKRHRQLEQNSAAWLAPTFAALLGATLSAAPAQTPVDYGNPSSWICLPGRSDSCSTPLRTTPLNPGGYGASEVSTVAKHARIDCFIVYPTVSRDSGMNSDLAPGDGEEKGVVQSQFARLASVCRTFAPLYRSMTIGAVVAASTGADLTGPATIAINDVRAAWRNYLATRNEGRPFVLVGHSQGSLMLIQLIARDIEGRPEAKRMRLAIVPGFNVLVPRGKRVGGTFKLTPLCSAPGQTNCVLSWVSYRERKAPPEGAMFGIADKSGMTVGCTNPARPGATGWVPLDSYWNTRSSLPVPGGPIIWSSEGTPPTPYVRTPGLVSGRCVNDGARGYLSIHTNADPGDKRTDRVGGEIGAPGSFLPGWGMHVSDISEAQGDIIRAIAALSARRANTRVRR